MRVRGAGQGQAGLRVDPSRLQQLLTQLVAVGATIAYAVVTTFVIVKVVDLILGIRVSARDEEIGIDLATHGEVAYQG